MKPVYLDWNATAPPLDEAVEAMARAAREGWGNPSSVHRVGRTARACVEDAREAVARLAGCDVRDVVFTSGGTEANNLALRSAFAERHGRLLVSRLEHPSITRVAEALDREGRAQVCWIAVRRDGTIDLDDLEKQARSTAGARLIALQSLNSETGVVQPVAQAIAIARRAGALVHVDAVQAFGRIESTGDGADSRSLAGHKMRGPKSIGALMTARGSKILPLLVGGSQERGVRPGTLDPVAAAGLAVAARHASTSVARWKALEPLRDAFEAAVLRLSPGARVNGASAARAPHVTSIAFAGWPGPELVAALDLEGVAASSGTACSAGTAEPSPVLTAMGDPNAAASSVRFSLGETTTREDLDAALAALSTVLHRSA